MTQLDIHIDQARRAELSYVKIAPNGTYLLLEPQFQTDGYWCTRHLQPVWNQLPHDTCCRQCGNNPKS